MPDDISIDDDLLKAWKSAPKTASKSSYDDLIERHARDNQIDPNLIRAVMSQESGGKPNAVSPKNARGLMQLIPATAARFGTRNIHNPDENIRGGARYLKFLNDRFKGNTDLVLAAYNAGEGAVEKFGNRIPPYRETQNYVPSVKARYQKLTRQQPQQRQAQTQPEIDPELLSAWTGETQPTAPPIAQPRTRAAKPNVHRPRTLPAPVIDPAGIAAQISGAVMRGKPAGEFPQGTTTGVATSRNAKLVGRQRTPQVSRADVMRAEEAPRPGTGTYDNIDPRLAKGEQPLDPAAYAKAQELVGRTEPIREVGGIRAGATALGPRDRGVIETITDAVDPYLRLDRPAGIKTDPIRGAASLGLLDLRRTITPEEKLIDPDAEGAAETAYQIGSFAPAVVPYVGAGKVISKIPALNAASREAHIARSALTFGSVELGREVARSAQMGEPLNPKEVAISTAIGTGIGGIAGVNPGLKRQIVAFITPGVVADVARGTDPQTATFNALTNLAFGLHSYQGAPREVKIAAKAASEQLRVRGVGREAERIDSRGDTRTIAPIERSDVANVASRSAVTEAVRTPSGQPVRGGIVEARRGEAVEAGEPLPRQGQVPEVQNLRGVTNEPPPQTKPQPNVETQLEGAKSLISVPHTEEVEALPSRRRGEDWAFFRIQDARSSLPKQSRNYWTGSDKELLDGVSGFSRLLEASRDLISGKDVDGLGINYRDSIKEDGGSPVLSVFKGRDLGDESSNVRGFSVAPDRATERRFTSEQVEEAWRQAAIKTFPEDTNAIRKMKFQELDEAYELSDLDVEAYHALRQIGSSTAARHVDLQPRRVRGEGKGQFKRESRAEREERRQQVNPPQVNPVLHGVYDDGTGGYIWDGFHRTGDAVITGRDTVPAIVGVPKSATPPAAEGGQKQAATETRPPFKPDTPPRIPFNERPRNEIGLNDIQQAEWDRIINNPSDYSGREGVIQIIERARLTREQKDALISRIPSVTPPAIQPRAPQPPSITETPASPKPSLTSARKAQFAGDRAELDLPELPVPERKRWQQTLDEAKAKGTANASVLAEEVLRRPRSLNDTETAQLVLRAQEIKNLHAEKMREIGAATDADSIAAKRAEVDALESEFDRLTQATKASGTEKGRALAAQKLTINQDFDLVSVKARMKAAKGRPLTEKENARYEQMVKERDAAVAQRDAALEKVRVQQIDREIQKAAKQRKRAETKEALDSEAATIKQNIAAEFARIRSQNIQASGLAGLDPEGVITKNLLRYARNRVKANVGIKAEQLIDDVHSLVKDFVDRRQVAELISGYKLAVPERQAEDVRRLAEIRWEIQGLLTQEDVAAGIRTAGAQGPSRRFVSRNEQRLKQLQAKEADLTRRIEESDFSRPPKPEPLPYTREVQRAQERVAKLDSQFKAEELRADSWHWLREISGMRKAGMLSGFMTHVRNITGTGAYQGFEELRRVPSVIFDAALFPSVGRTVTLSPSAALDGVVQAAIKGRREAGEIMRVGATKEQLERQQLQEINTGVKAVDLAFNSVFRFMSASDRIFYQHAYKRNLTERAQARAITERRLSKSVNVRERTRELSNEPSPELDADAKHDALVATFNNNNFLSSAIRRGRGAIGPVGNFALDMVLPFDRTPTNVMARVIEASPLGYGKNAGQIARALWNGKTSRAEKRAMSETFGRATTGTGIATLGFMLAAKGLIAVDDYNNAYLNVGNKQINLSGVAPLGTLLATGAGLYTESRKRSKKRNYLKPISKPLIDQPLLQATTQITDVVEDPERSAARTGARTAFSFVPFSGAVRTVAEATDPIRRKPQGFTEEFQRNIPLLRRSLKRHPVQTVGRKR